MGLSCVGEGTGTSAGHRCDLFEYRTLSEEVAKDLHYGFTLGMTSTPTFVINGRPLVGARPCAEFQAVIDGLLK